MNFLAVLWVAEPPHDKHKKATTTKYTQLNSSDEEEASTAASSIRSRHSADDEGAIIPTSTEETPLIKNNNALDTHEQQAPITILSLCKNWRILCCVLCTIVSSSVFSGIEPALPIHLEKAYDASASLVGCKLLINITIISWETKSKHNINTLLLLNSHFRVYGDSRFELILFLCVHSFLFLQVTEPMN